MSKPTHVLNIEKILEIELSEATNPKLKNKSFSLDANRELTALNLSNLNISDQLDELLGRIDSLIFLDIQRNNISNISFLKKLENLQYLYLNNNKIDDILPLSNLNRLKELEISGNYLFSINALSELKNIEKLVIANNIIFDINELRGLRTLTYLDISENKISDIIPIQNLTNLTTLIADGNEIENKNVIGKLNLLQTLFVSGKTDGSIFNHLKNLKTIYIDDGHISDLTFLKDMSDLRVLWLANNDIFDISALSKLTNIEALYLRKNKIEDIRELRNLTNLEVLSISNNLIEEVSSLEKLGKLQTLDISYNKVTDVSPLIKLFRKAINSEEAIHIDITNNPIKNPPSEVVNEGQEAIVRYFEDALKSGVNALNECKVILIGDGSVGKTSLMKRIVFGTFDNSEKTTHGINKLAWNEIKKTTGEQVKINIWDFGGQHIQHSMHQFFFTERVIYILVLSPRNDQKASYWLEQIDKLGTGSEILIVYNWKEAKDKEANYLVNFYELRKKYSFLTDPFTVSCKTGEGVPEFKERLKEVILKKKELNDSYPLNWYNIKTLLESNVSIGKNYISYDTYRDWCIQNEYPNEADQKGLLNTLNRAGSIVFFNRPVLNQLQILNPEWITTGVYAILTSNITDKKRGHLNHNDLVKIFSEEKEIYSDKKIKIKYNEHQYQFIIQLMKEYNLCQENPLNKNEYLIPSVFKGEPENDYKNHKTESRRYRIQFESPFEMLLMHRFIAKNINKTISEDYWQSGVFIKDFNTETYALVETNLYSFRIDFWIKGDDIRGFWESMRRDFHEIFSLYKRFEFTEEVLYTSEGKEVFLPYQEMLDSLKNGVMIIPYHPTYKIKNIDVLKVIDLFEDSGKSIHGIEMEAASVLEGIKLEFNPVINNNPQFTQRIDNKNITNIKIETSNIKELDEIKELLLDLKDFGKNNEQWQEELIKCLSEFNRIETAADKADQKTSISIIGRAFRKLKDLKDIVAIGLLPVDIDAKFPKLLELWDAFKAHF